MGRKAVQSAAMAVLLMTGSGAAPSLQNPPVADDVTLTVAPGETALIPFSGTDADGDLFGFMPTSGLSNPSAGVLRTACVCSGTYFGEICSCTSFFVAAADFSGSVTFTYRAIDATGLQSADATATINSTVQTRTPEQILDEIEFVVRRATVPGGDLDPGFGEKLSRLGHKIRTALTKGHLEQARKFSIDMRDRLLPKGIEAGELSGDAAVVLSRIVGELAIVGYPVCVDIKELTAVLAIDLSEKPWEPDFDNPAESVGAWIVFADWDDDGQRGTDGVVDFEFKARSLQGELLVVINDPIVHQQTILRDFNIDSITLHKHVHQHNPGTWDDPRNDDTGKVDTIGFSAEDLVRMFRVFVRRTVPLQSGEVRIRGWSPTGQLEFPPFGTGMRFDIDAEAVNHSECGLFAKDDINVIAHWDGPTFNGVRIDAFADIGGDCVFCPF